MSDQLAQDMLKLARRLANEATPIARSHLGQIRPSGIERKADNSVVTEADHAIQAHLLQAVARAYPDHAMCAEETLQQPDAHASRADARYCWVIDPLDGTRNYAAGFPCFATSIAVLDRGRPVVAIVIEHNLRHLYAAAEGRGTTLNDIPIHVEEAPLGSDLLVGIPSSKDQLTVSVLRSWVATRGLVCRNLGSTALHLGLVASGALGAAFSKQCKIWDVAAGVLLITEAGGRVTDQFGADYLPFDLDADPEKDLPLLAAAPKTHERLLDSIKRVVP